MKTTLHIRPERPEEFGAIHSLIKTAFETARVKDGTEQDFASGLRAGANYIPELALVALNRGKLVGHIMLTRTFIDRNGGRIEALLLAPISVLVEYRNRGVGGALIREGFGRAKKMGFKVVFLVGDPAYYSRFGFRLVRGTGIRLSPDTPREYADYTMVCELEEGFLTGVRGEISIC